MTSCQDKNTLANLTIREFKPGFSQEKELEKYEQGFVDSHLEPSEGSVSWTVDRLLFSIWKSRLPEVFYGGLLQPSSEPPKLDPTLENPTSQGLSQMQHKHTKLSASWMLQSKDEGGNFEPSSLLRRQSNQS